MAIISYDSYLKDFKYTNNDFVKENIPEMWGKNIKIAHNIDYPSIQGYYQNFDRFYSIYNDLEMDKLTQYVFMVRPDLNVVNPNNPLELSDTCATNAYLSYMCASHNIVLRSLTDSFPDANHDFIPFLVGRTEAIQMPDISIKNNSISQPFTNILMPYGSNMWESLTGGTFDITFREDRDLRIHKLFQTWLYYIDGVSRGVFKPKKKYIDYNKYDYMTSVYYFVCQADGETLVWWNKYTGAFPTTVPNSDMSFNLRGAVDNRLSIPFAYFMQDIPMNPMVLIDFNRNSSGESNSNTGKAPAEYLSIYDENVGGTRNGLYGAPFITDFKIMVRSNKIFTSASVPKLKWRKPKTF
jgi:hypothetical protein